MTVLELVRLLVQFNPEMTVLASDKDGWMEIESVTYGGGVILMNTESETEK